MPTWQFERFIPDDSDISAEISAKDQWAEAMRIHPVKFRGGAIDPDDPTIRYAFTCGFNRGASWMRDKTINRIKEALVKEAGQ